MRGDGITKALLVAISANPGTNPSKKIQQTFEVSRQAVLLQINALINEGLIRADGRARGRSYHPVGLEKRQTAAPLPSAIPKDQINASWEAPLEE